MTQPHVAIQGLQLHTCDGLESPPYTAAPIQFGNNHPKQEWPHVKGDGHDKLGRKSHRFPFTYRFENIAGRADIFPDLFRQWWRLLTDGEQHEIVHPIVGSVIVIVEEGDVQLVAQTTAGVVVDVTYEEHVDDPSREQDITVEPVSIIVAGKAAIAALQQLSIPFPSGESATSLLDLFKQIDGLIGQAEMAVLGYVNKAKAMVDEFFDFAEGLNDHATFPATSILTQLWGALDDAAQKVGAKARPTATAVARTETTLDAFARERGNSLNDVIGLNIEALLAPSVPAGTLLRYYP